jgi:hypothetical protein
MLCILTSTAIGLSIGSDVNKDGLIFQKVLITLDLVEMRHNMI